jgi:molybdopterin-containing oxidoreductase family iron-sulfur binding subunit
MEQKTYWKGLEELHEDPEFLKERDKVFADELPVEEIFNSSIVNKPTSRRDFKDAGLQCVGCYTCSQLPHSGK